jgi:hypothetical protein
VRRIVQTTRKISGYRTDFGNGDEEALDVIRWLGRYIAIAIRAIGTSISTRSLNGWR